MRRVEIGRKGRIIGDDRYTYVLVQEGTGRDEGYLLLLWVDEDVRNTYDDWVANESDLADYFEHAGWTIDWL